MVLSAQKCSNHPIFSTSLKFYIWSIRNRQNSFQIYSVFSSFPETTIIQVTLFSCQQCFRQQWSFCCLLAFLKSIFSGTFPMIFKVQVRSHYSRVKTARNAWLFDHRRTGLLKLFPSVLVSRNLARLITQVLAELCSHLELKVLFQHSAYAWHMTVSCN